MKDQEVVIAYLQAFKWSQRKAINQSSYVNLDRIILLGSYSSSSERQVLILYRSTSSHMKLMF